jgi:hypothetical protein
MKTITISVQLQFDDFSGNYNVSLLAKEKVEALNLQMQSEEWGSPQMFPDTIEIVSVTDDDDEATFMDFEDKADYERQEAADKKALEQMRNKDTYSLPTEDHRAMEALRNSTFPDKEVEPFDDEGLMGDVTYLGIPV